MRKIIAPRPLWQLPPRSSHEKPDCLRHVDRLRSCRGGDRDGALSRGVIAGALSGAVVFAFLMDLVKVPLFRRLSLI
jgi:hypothetical protein